MSTLPSFQEIHKSPSGVESPLAIALDLLFEHSPILSEKMEPQLSSTLKTLPPLNSYVELIDIALSELTKWDSQAQAQFISGHPRIGETKNLSKLSANEQGGNAVRNPTPPEVLERLTHLNACYEVAYPGLRYITFVNGRSRATIAEEIEAKLHLPHSLSAHEPALHNISQIEPESEGWQLELTRAMYDIGQIARSRLGALGLL